MNAATEIIENIFKEKPLDLYDIYITEVHSVIFIQSLKKRHKR